MRALLDRWPALRWLLPGIGVKRWVALLAAGITALALGLAYVLVELYRQQPFPAWSYYATLQFVPRLGRALLFVGLGFVLVVIALLYLNRSLLSLLVAQPASEPAQPRADGPRVVALGGGHGLSTLLRGLKAYTGRITAIATVADDGGSSGVLRKELGLPPPGDLRNCIAALAEAEPLMAELLQYRFGRGTSLEGHALGNLLIAAMAGVTGGFESAIAEVSRILAVRGRILPSTLEDVVLCAEVRLPDGSTALVSGQSRIAHAEGPIARAFLQPSGVRGHPEAIRALLQADLIVLGPGSLYTSVLPNLLIGDIAAALRASRALKVYVCNVATQPGETGGYDLADHVQALARHLGPGFCDLVLGNASLGHVLAPESGSEMVQPATEQEIAGCRVVLAELADAELPWRHDSAKLAAALLHLHREAMGGATQPHRGHLAPALLRLGGRPR